MASRSMASEKELFCARGPKLTKILYEISDLEQDFKISNKDLRKDFIILSENLYEIASNISIIFLNHNL